MDDSRERLPQTFDLLRMATDIVAAYLRKNAMPSGQIAETIRAVHGALASLGDSEGSGIGRLRPAIAIRRSVTPDYLVCLEDGKKLKMLKRHLRTTYNMTPEQYRAKWGLPIDYPMVASNYAKRRSDFAKSIGLGRSGGRAAARSD